MVYYVHQMKRQRLFFRASEEDLEVLRSVADTLGLKASQAIFTVLREKQLALAVRAAKANGATGSKKRRPRAA
jgi:hypothetical protein